MFDLSLVERVLSPNASGDDPLDAHHCLAGEDSTPSPCGSHSRVVGVDVDVMQNRLGQGEDVDDRPLQDVTGLCEELIKAPALSLFDLQDVGQDGHQLALQPPTHRSHKDCQSQAQASRRNFPRLQKKCGGSWGSAEIAWQS